MLWLCPASPRALTGTDPGSLHHDGQFSPLLSSQLLLRQAGRGCLQTCSLPLASLQLLTPAPKLPWTSLLGTPTAFAPQTCARRTRGSTQEAGRSPRGCGRGALGGSCSAYGPCTGLRHSSCFAPEVVSALAVNKLTPNCSGGACILLPDPNPCPGLRTGRSPARLQQRGTADPNHDPPPSPRSEKQAAARGPETSLPFSACLPSPARASCWISPCWLQDCKKDEQEDTAGIRGTCSV